MSSIHSRERGQILILFVFALTVLLGFTALAIDGGMMYADRRLSQSVADASSMAGAGAAAQTFETRALTYNEFNCNQNNAAVMAAVNAAYTAARSRAVQNNITTLDNNLADKHGIEIICVNLPNQGDRYLDVHTRVSTNVTTSFMHLFYSGSVINTVDAVARIRPRALLANGNAIVSLNNDTSSGIEFDGSVIVTVEGGGISSNSVIEGKGSFKVMTKENAYPITYAAVNGLNINGKAGSFKPNPTYNPAKIVANIPPPTCGNGAAVSSNGGNIGPGNYSSITLNNGTLRMSPGLYCLSGDFTATGGNVDGTGITIYLMGNSNFRIAGNADLQIEAATNNPVNGALPGVLIYMAQGNTGEFSLLGTSDNTYHGTVYAPNGTIEVGGNSRLETAGESNKYTQLIGFDVKIHGNPEITIKYVENLFNSLSPTLDLVN